MCKMIGYLYFLVLFKLDLIILKEYRIFCRPGLRLQNKKLINRLE